MENKCGWPLMKLEGRSDKLIKAGVHVIAIGLNEHQYELEMPHRLFFLLESRPGWFHRLMQRLCFGFKWSTRTRV